VDAAGNAYFSGVTFSSNFPTTGGAFDTTYAGGTCGTPPDTFPCPDAFVIKVNARGNAPIYSTFLGGTGDDFGDGIVVDPLGNAYIVGGTDSTDFPTVNPLQAANAGDFDVFLAKLDPAGSALVFSTYLGGSSWDKPSGLALRLGDVFLQGTTASTDFPVMNALHSGGWYDFGYLLGAAMFLGGAARARGLE